MRRLRLRAAEHGRSVEEEAREILRTALNRQPAPPRRLGTAIHALFGSQHGIELVTAPREPIRKPPRFA